MGRLSGKTAIITGASQGMGASHAQAYYQRLLHCRHAWLGCID